MFIYEKSKYFSAETEGDGRYGLSPFAVRALRARGAETFEQIKAFLHPSTAQFPDPFLFNDMEKAAARIRRAMNVGEKICVFGDYDVDGICATAMLTDYLSSVGGNVCFHIPSRRDEGYGITKNAAAKLKSEGVQLIITVDNGISAAPEIAYCRELGLDVIVTDHHLPPQELPECCGIICHTLKGSRYPDNILCGAGIAFKLVQALAGNEKAMEYVSLAALATVADVVPLVRENRALVYFGIKAVNSGDCCTGLKRLLESVLAPGKKYNSFTFGFVAAPRLNAAGRMKDASLAAELFLSKDEKKIDAIIAELNALNELRQKEETKIFNDVCERLKMRDLTDERALIIRSPDWNPGVIGIAASRISEMYNRPTILFSESDGLLKGSGRSVEGVNLYSALEACSRFFVRYGGHSKAAGLTMKAENFDKFRSAFNEYLKNTYADETFVPKQFYEFETELKDITPKLVSELSSLEPFGEGNPCPVFRTRGAHALKIRRFGNDGKHIRIDFEKDRSAREAVWFSGAENFEKAVNAETADILYTIGMNRYNGFEKLQLKLVCFNAEPPKNPESYVKYRIPEFLSALISNCSFSDLPHSGAESVFYRKKEDDTTETNKKTETGSAGIEYAKIDIEKQAGEFLSGALILANTPAAAIELLKKTRGKGINNTELYIGKIPSFLLPGAVILLAPVIAELPKCGFAKVICYDMPPAAENLQLIKKKLPGVRLIVNSEASGDYDALVSRLDCSRTQFSVCYREMYKLLTKRGHSFAELVKRLAENISVTEQQAEFEVSVFTELGFITENAVGSLVNGKNLKVNPLTNSVLFNRVCALKNKSGK